MEDDTPCLSSNMCVGNATIALNCWFKEPLCRRVPHVRRPLWRNSFPRLASGRRRTGPPRADLVLAAPAEILADPVPAP